MNLLEFFGNNMFGIKEKPDADIRDKDFEQAHYDDKTLVDNIYWFILDNDEIHRRMFMPLAKEVESILKSKKADRKIITKKFLPMVNRGCMEYYKTQQLTGDPKLIFSKKIRKGLCKRLADQCCDDIERKEYTLEETRKQRNIVRVNKCIKIDESYNKVMGKLIEILKRK